MASLALLFAAAALLILAWQDLRRRRLPNAWVLAYASAFAPFAFAAELGWPAIGLHAATAIAAFALTFLFFALGWLAGGDVKLWAALMLWAGPDLALQAAVTATLAGGVLGVLCWMAGKLAPRYRPTAWNRILRLFAAQRGVPYGVALATSGMLMLWIQR